MFYNEHIIMSCIYYENLETMLNTHFNLLTVFLALHLLEHILLIKGLPFILTLVFYKYNNIYDITVIISVQIFEIAIRI